jgi:hypothetical protein
MNESGTSTTTPFVLPAQFRPAHTVFIPVDTVNATTGRLEIETNGTVAVEDTSIGDESANYGWTAPVWFCEPWIPSFGLLGLTGFLDHFEVTIAAYDELFELTPIS